MPCSSSEIGVGKTQTQTTVKEIEDILRRWESGERSDKKYVKPRAGYNDFDKLTWERFTMARAKNTPVSDRMNKLTTVKVLLSSNS